jgi:lysophospholipase L1-like esterase
MRARLQKLLEHPATQYKQACILGGLNDLSSFTDQHNVTMANLTAMVEQLLAHGCETVVLCAVPLCHLDTLIDMPSYRERKVTLNISIRKLAADLAPRVLLCDVAAQLPYPTLPEERRREVWDDHLHFTPEGYDELADLIFDTLTFSSALP